MTPTKEQHELAYRLWHYEPPEKIAQALADEAEAAQAWIDALETRLSQAKAELKIAWSDCHDGECNACPKCCDAARAEAESLRAEAAKATADLRALRDAVHDRVQCVDHADACCAEWCGDCQIEIETKAKLAALAPRPNPTCPSGKEKP